jgi:hypothetical protein
MVVDRTMPLEVLFISAVLCCVVLAFAKAAVASLVSTPACFTRFRDCFKRIVRGIYSMPLLCAFTIFVVGYFYFDGLYGRVTVFTFNFAAQSIEELFKGARGHSYSEIETALRSAGLAPVSISETSLCVDYSKKKERFYQWIEDYSAPVWTKFGHDEKTPKCEYLCGWLADHYRYCFTFENGICIKASVFTSFPRHDVSSIAGRIAYSAEQFERLYFIMSYGPPDIATKNAWKYQLRNESVLLKFKGQECIGTEVQFKTN